MKRWRLVAWNIRAGGGVRVPRIAGALLDLEPDAMILSEFRGTPPSRTLAALLADGGYVHQTHTCAQVPDARNALLIAARVPLETLRSRYHPREPGRWQMVRIASPAMVLAGMHVPNQHTGRKPEFHETVLRLMRRWGHTPAVFAGDTNSGRRGLDEETAVFNQATDAWFGRIHRLGWRDGFRLKHGNTREFTWYSPGHDNGFRLDQAFVSPRLTDRVQDVRHVWFRDGDSERRDAVSDHAAVLLDLDAAGL